MAARIGGSCVFLVLWYFFLKHQQIFKYHFKKILSESLGSCGFYTSRLVESFGNAPKMCMQSPWVTGSETNRL